MSNHITGGKRAETRGTFLRHWSCTSNAALTLNFGVCVYACALARARVRVRVRVRARARACACACALTDMCCVCREEAAKRDPNSYTAEEYYLRPDKPVKITCNVYDLAWGGEEKDGKKKKVCNRVCAYTVVRVCMSEGCVCVCMRVGLCVFL